MELSQIYSQAHWIFFGLFILVSLVNLYLLLIKIPKEISKSRYLEDMINYSNSLTETDIDGK